MTNNFKIIKPLLTFEDVNDFYFLQIIKRRKDNPGMMGDNIVLSNYYISSVGYFDLLEDRVIEQCKSNNARAYIRLNKRNYEKVGLQTLRKIADCIVNKEYKSIKTAYDSACGEFSSDPDKKWIVDIDIPPTTIGNSLMLYTIYQNLEKLQIKANQEPLMNIIPTKNGIHIITRPFPLNEFKKMYPNIDVHKDNPTILYVS